MATSAHTVMQDEPGSDCAFGGSSGGFFYFFRLHFLMAFVREKIT